METWMKGVLVFIGILLTLSTVVFLLNLVRSSG